MVVWVRSPKKATSFWQGLNLWKAAELILLHLEWLNPLQIESLDFLARTGDLRRERKENFGRDVTTV